MQTLGAAPAVGRLAAFGDLLRIRAEEPYTTRVGRFSLGRRQRLSLATALLGEPAALVLDEPTNGLDPEGIRSIRCLVRDHAAAGGTVLLSSHQMTEIAEVADDLVVIAAGRIVAAGPLTQIAAGHATLEDAYFALTGAGTGSVR